MTQIDNKMMQKWLDGQISLGAAAKWEKDEIRIISEIAYVLAQQGRISEAIVLFEGLSAVAPATAYFQAALGAMFLRLKNSEKAIGHLDSALKTEPGNIPALVNRGEAFLQNEDWSSAQKDLNEAIQIGTTNTRKQKEFEDETDLAIRRAQALLKAHKQ